MGVDLRALIPTTEEQILANVSHVYYAGAPGVDGAKMRQEAEQKSAKGEVCLVHAHAAGRPCNKDCTIYAQSVIKPLVDF